MKKYNEIAQQIVDESKQGKYCVGSPKMVAVPYTGQYAPVIIAEKKEVEKWLANFWKSIYKK